MRVRYVPTDPKAYTGLKRADVTLRDIRASLGMDPGTWPRHKERECRFIGNALAAEGWAIEA